MGVDYYAYAVIGCEVTGKLYRMVTKENPDCPHAKAPDAAFCSRCGRTARVDVREPIPGLDGDRLGILQVVKTTDARRHFAGVAVGTISRHHNDDADASALVITAETIRSVQSELERFGLWDPDSFAMWAVQYISY